MAHDVYDNFYLSNEIEDQYKSHLDLQNFCTVDNSLVGTAGMKRMVNVYSATEGTEKLKITKGNTKSIEVSYAEKEYEILLAQNRFIYYDEQAMSDPMLVPVGVRRMGSDMFNTVNADIFAEFNKGTQLLKPKAYGFDCFADSVAMLNVESTDNDPSEIMSFAFVNPTDMAAIRKALKDELKYVESFSRSGYVGTVAGVNIYTKKDAVTGTCVVATNKAVTLFNKKGVEVEQERDSNIRENRIFSRKYYLAALTDNTKVVKIIITP